MIRLHAPSVDMLLEEKRALEMLDKVKRDTVSLDEVTGLFFGEKGYRGNMKNILRRLDRKKYLHFNGETIKKIYDIKEILERDYESR